MDQNLILQGESILFSSAHALGFFSTINPKVIREVNLYRSILPAEYGGRLSSVLVVDTRSGNREKIRIGGGMGPVSARFNVEGPFANKAGSFLASWRGSYSDWILQQVQDPAIKRSTASFYDVNLLVDYDLSEADQLHLSLYAAKDQFSYNQAFGFNYGTRAAEVGYEKKWNNGLISELSLVANTFEAAREQLSGLATGILTNGITYYKIKEKVTWPVGDDWHFTAGFENIWYRQPGQQLTPTGEVSTLTATTLEKEQARESALFAEATWQLHPNVTIKAGLRGNHYQYLGGRTLLAYEGDFSDNNVSDTLRYGSGDAIATYRTLEPRVSLLFRMTDQHSLRGGYSRTSQYVNQVFNTDTPAPQSQFQLSTPYIPPFLAHNFSLGWFANTPKNHWEFGVEGFYRAFDQLWDYKDFAVLNLNPYLEQELITGQGKAYGAEVTLKRRASRFEGQFSYTWSRTTYQIPGINAGNWYPAPFDQPHNVNAVLQYRINERQRLNANFVYASGRPTTAPLTSYSFTGALPVPIYTERNQLRIPDYHRLDVSWQLGMNKNKEKGFKTSWDFTLYNVYGRRNPFSVFYTQRANQRYDFVANRLSVLGAAFPSISFNFEWL
ncbi:MAG: TonB-dependent receptor [Saprospiraceae bacterium]